MHLVAPLREFFEANTDWLTVFQLPTYAPDLNPQEGVWSLVKCDIGNLAAADLSQVTRAVKRKLKMLQYRPEVIDGCLAGTGLSMDLAPDRCGDANARPLTAPGVAASSPCLC